MPITDIFIRRPVFATVLSLLLLLLGGMSIYKLHVRQFPEIQTSVITVSTSYAGASGKLMEGFVTTPLESQLAGLDGLDYMTSSSTQGSSVITLNFKLGYDIDKAITDVSDRVSAARYQLPNEVNDPIISKEDPNAQPTMYIAFNSQSLTPEAISDYLSRIVQPQLETLAGVGQAQILGEQNYAMRIWLDPDLMAAHHISPSDVATALQANNVQTAAGRIDGKLQEFDINAKTDLTTAAEFNKLVIKDDNGKAITVADIGHAQLASADPRSSVFMNGSRSIVIGIIPKSTANPLAVAKLVNKQLAIIQRHLPANLQASMVWDSSKFISESIHEVIKTILEACLFVVIVIFLFLGSARSVLIPVITIPLSLIGSCALMLAMGFTLNTLTLLAWVLAIGMVVDDAIVVVENIHRRIERGIAPMEAALTGAREIRFAVIAMTLTLAAVFAPIGFMEGLTGTLFREFAFTLAGTVIVSGFIALTLTPMMCSKLLKHSDKKQGLEAHIESIFTKVSSFYQGCLDKVMRRRIPVLIAVVSVLVIGWSLFHMTPSTLAPAEDQGGIMAFAEGTSTANLAYMEKYTKQIRQVFDHVPERVASGMINGFPQGINSAIGFLVLKPWSERTRTAMQIKQSLFPQLWSIPGIMAFPLQPPSLPGASGFTPIDFVILSTADYTTINRYAGAMLAKIRHNPELTNPRLTIKIDKPQLNVSVDRNTAANLGISMQQIGDALHLLLGEPTVTRFTMAGRSYDVIPELYSQFRLNPHALKAIQVRTGSGALVPLSNLASLKMDVGPTSYDHFQQLRAIHIQASLAPGYTLGQGLNYLKSIATQILPKNISVDYAGQSRQFIQASGAMEQTFIFALLFIFLVLSAQFESFRAPIIILLFSVPLTVTGALIAMHFTDSTLNIYTEIGLVTLIGLISKHGILIVEFANQLRTEGLSAMQAVTKSATIRLRPILMTTAAMVLGAAPLAFASGAGAVSRHQMGWVIIGGMTIGTLFTLFVVPVAYSYFGKEI